MSETIKVQVPLTGSNVVREGDGPPAGQSGSVVDGVYTPPEGGRFVGGVYKPPEKTPSLHQAGHQIREAAARRRGETELVTEWQEDRHGGGRFVQSHRPVQRQPEPQAPAPPDPLAQRISTLTDAVTLLAQQQLGIQPDQGPQMPNPAAYDFWDPQQEGEYHAALKAYVDAEAQRRINAEIEPYRGAMKQAQEGYEIQKQFDAVVAEHGEDPNFRRVMSAALELVADNPGMTIQDAYKSAGNPANAKPGVRGNAHVPKQLKTLGQIMAHNRTTGRAGGRGRR